jgi:4-carboxymuconolactone decarboxylase
MTGAEKKALMRLSAALALRDVQELRWAMEECVTGADPSRTEEVILQSYLFLGYPIALNAFGTWRGISERKAGVSVPDAWEAWSDRGSEVCRTVYGGQYDGLRRNVRDLHPDMERWMVVEGYGKVLGRPELELAVRELCIVALLAVLGAPRQLHSHLRGALNAGATIGDLEAALEVAGSFLGEEGRTETQAIWERVRRRWTGAPIRGDVGNGMRPS